MVTMKNKVITTIAISLISFVGIFAFLIRPFNVNPSNNVSLNIVPVCSDSLQIAIFNNSDFPISFSNEYYIEVKSFFYWRKVNFQPTSFTSLGHKLDPGETYSTSINYSSIYGILSPGQYRLVKNFEYNNSSAYFAGYFSIE